jgi:hypothetical protein
MLVALILFYRRQFRELGYSWNLHKMCWCVVNVEGLQVYYGLDLSSTN